MIKIIIGLVSLMLANILLGATLAKFKKEFKKKIFFNGMFKGACIILGCLLMYICAYLNQDILVASINGNNVNLMEGMNTIFIAGIVIYSVKDLKKLADILNISTDIEEEK